MRFDWSLRSSSDDYSTVFGTYLHTPGRGIRSSFSSIYSFTSIRPSVFRLLYTLGKRVPRPLPLISDSLQRFTPSLCVCVYTLSGRKGNEGGRVLLKPSQRIQRQWRPRGRLISIVAPAGTYDLGTAWKRLGWDAIVYNYNSGVYTLGSGESIHIFLYTPIFMIGIEIRGWQAVCKYAREACSYVVTKNYKIHAYEETVSTTIMA